MRYCLTQLSRAAYLWLENACIWFSVQCCWGCAESDVVRVMLWCGQHVNDPASDQAVRPYKGLNINPAPFTSLQVNLIVIVDRKESQHKLSSARSQCNVFKGLTCVTKQVLMQGNKALTLPAHCLHQRWALQLSQLCSAANIHSVIHRNLGSCKDQAKYTQSVSISAVNRPVLRQCRAT